MQIRVGRFDSGPRLHIKAKFNRHDGQPSNHPAVIGFSLAAVILLLARRDHLYLAHGFFWFVVAALVMFLGLWPGLIDRLALMAGISYPPALLFLGSVMVLIVKALHTDMVNTRVERQVRRLNQRLAIYEIERLPEPAPKQ